MKLEVSRPKGGPITAEIDTFGGRLTSLRVDGMQLLVEHSPDSDNLRWGCYPMAPWCGRLARGRLNWTDPVDEASTVHRFPLTSPPHAIHGLVNEVEWTQIDETTIATDLADPWPFGGRVTQSFDLTAHSLTIHGEIRAGDMAMPAMFGWHPWFRKQLTRGKSATLSLIAESAYSTDDNMIPTGHLGPVPSAPWDTCMVDLLLDPVIVWGNALTLTVSSTFDHWVIYTEPEHALCVEPQSGPPNEPNSDPRVLQPGESLSGSMTLTWT
ncbi:MAG: aldose 1-epimerase [Actinomycetia bacterium]|nr:aldose 1-epimerase [Actinomycetes bacterium]MCP4960781.1 aldose 1-epimerase [Actinomycetes bacterium]